MKSDKHLAAVFDVDGTLIANDSLERIFVRYLWRYGEINWSDLARASVQSASRFLIERKSAQEIMASSKLYLRGKSASHLQRVATDCFEQQIRHRLLPAALARLKWHQECGHDVMLLSGTLSALIEPLAAWLNVSHFIGTEMEVMAQQLTGRIQGLHPYGTAKIICLKSALRENLKGRIDLSRSFAYGDSYADRYLLAAVGNPVAANPDRRLRKLARQRGWMIEDFAAGYSALTTTDSRFSNLSDNH